MCAYNELYGGRGIRICREWANEYLVFKKWALSHGYEDDLTIDRIDSSGGYSPENCQWLSNSENVKKRWVEYRKKICLEKLRAALAEPSQVY